MKNPFIDQRFDNEFDNSENNFASKERSVYQTPTKANKYPTFGQHATPNLNSPSKAALKYSPKRNVNNNHIIPIHGNESMDLSPSKHISRSEAVKLESPTRDAPVLYNLDDDSDDDYESNFHNSFDSPSKIPPTVNEVDLSDVGSYSAAGSYKERMTSYSSYSSSNFSGDTFKKTRFNTNHHDLQYIRRANSTVRPKVIKK
ncbi:unnamed protein product [Hanseniaspora opuntiae]